MSETTKAIYEKRIENARKVMEESGTEYMFIGPGADLRYLIGTPGIESERMMLLILSTKEEPVMIVPTLEKLATGKHTFFELLDWRDGEGPQGRLHQVLSDSAHREVKTAVGARLHSAFLLELQKVLPKAQWTVANEVMKKLRITKSPDEIQMLKDAAWSADRTFDEVMNMQFSGRTEREIANEINKLLVKHGQEQALFCIVASGQNGAQPHYHTGDKVIEPGDAVVLDFGGSRLGYCSDMTRTVLVAGGTADSHFHEVYDTVNRANAAAHQQAKPGVTCESIDAAARTIITSAGYGEFFVHRTGHGIGMEVHEEPYIVTGNQTIVEPGMAFSNEPGIYLPGRFGVRIEDIVVVTQAGSENINLSTHDLVTVK